MANPAVKVADLDAACAYYERAGAEIRDRMDWNGAERADGELTSYHDLDDDWGSNFRDSGRHWLRWRRTGESPLRWSGEEAVDALRVALAAYASSAAGGVGVHPGKVE